MLIDSLDKFRKDHPDSLKVALFMTKFSNNEPYIDIFNSLKKIYLENGIKLLRADDKMYHPDLYTNVETYMHSCGSGVAFFDTMENEDYNPNVAFEVGYMMSLKKPVCLLKNKFNKNLQTDLMGKLYISLNPFKPEESLKEPVSVWLSDNNLCLNCSELYLTLNEDLFKGNVTTEKFEKIDNKIKAFKRPNHTLNYKGVSRNDSENTVFSYECSHDFFECVYDFFKSGALESSLGHKILSVSQFKNSGYKNYDYAYHVKTFPPNTKEEELLVQVCKLSAIEGHYKEKSTAESLFSNKETTDLNQSEVYITATETNGIKLFYFQTNFLIRGFDYPAKALVYEDHYNLFEILRMLVTLYMPYQKVVDERLIILHCTKIKYIIDRSMISSHGNFKIDLDGARNIKLI